MLWKALNSITSCDQVTWFDLSLSLLYTLNWKKHRVHHNNSNVTAQIVSKLYVAQHLNLYNLWLTWKLELYLAQLAISKYHSSCECYVLLLPYGNIICRKLQSHPAGWCNEYSGENYESYPITSTESFQHSCWSLRHNIGMWSTIPRAVTILHDHNTKVIWSLFSIQKNG